MTNSKLAVSVLLLLLAVSLSCKLFNRKTSRSNGPKVDLVTPGKPLNISVKLDKKQTTSKLVPRTGGSVSLTAADGSKFTLDVPADALDADTMITMTAVKSIAGAPLAEGPMAAVQLEPSGLFFKEITTLTIVPAKELPVKDQIVFGYEGDGKDYHLAVVDPKSKDIKIKLMEFSGAGVGSRSDSAWAANLQIEATSARAKLMQKLGEATHNDRRSNLLGGDGNEAADMIDSFFEQFYDQVVLKKIAAAELDCKFAQEALDDLLWLDRFQKVLVSDDLSKSKIPGFAEKALRLADIGANCPAPYQIAGGAGSWQTNTKVCDIMKPFTLTGGGFTMKHSGGLSGTVTYTGPFSGNGGGTYTISLPDGVGKPGTMTVGGSGTITGDKVYTGSGTAKYTLTPIEPCK
jgi:hypothetical protein